ncbi:hypothetical protein F4808DRAFT_453492 [Astrocystis sublimbata]|nr:hypothetical protein F4808DRAFT_453492 [Astrocystis sublimbata]
MDILAQLESSASALVTAVQHVSRHIRESDVEIDQARSNILSMVAKIQILVYGPTDFLEHLSTQNQMLACLRWLGKTQILACIPHADTVPIKDVADLAHVPESQLRRVIRMTATAGFLREEPHGSVGHTLLSNAFFDNPSLLDATIFVAESAAPAALKMEALSVNDPSRAGQTAYNLAVATTDPFRVACEKVPRLSRQYRAYLLHAAGLRVNDALSDTLTQLNWSKLRNPRVVEVGAQTKTTAQKLANTYPSLQFVVQTLDPPPFLVAETPDFESVMLPPNLKVLPRALGTRQTVTDAGVYIFHIPSSSPETICSELQAHCGILRANNSVMLIPTAHLLPKSGDECNLVAEAVARSRDLTYLQLANERELELTEVLDLIDTVKDGSGRLVVSRKLLSSNNAVTALIVKWQEEHEFFAQSNEFWNNYLKGRPSPPQAFFDRIFTYHQTHGSVGFGTVHDVGAGNGPYAQKLRTRFSHVVVSDVVAKNVVLAESRLGTDGFTYRVAKMEDADDIEPASVDMVFATNVMHFCDQKAAMAAVARQLKPGGTFVCSAFGAARFVDDKVQDIWTRINHQGGRLLLRKTETREQTLGILARTADHYNVAPLDPDLFTPGATRFHLNMDQGGIPALIPPEEQHMNAEPDYVGPNDVEIYEDEEGWSFTADLEGVKEHINSFPFVSEDPSAFATLFGELEEIMGDGKVVQGYWPATVILATRR